MRTSQWIGALCCLLILGCGKADFRKAQIDDYTLSSNFTGENYRVQILLPKGYSPDKTYPMVYLLDGHFHFDELGEDLLSMMESGETSEVLIAGISYADYPFEGKPSNLDNLSTIYDVRRTDLLFPRDTLDDGKVIGGGALDFYRFLVEELAPVLESAYPVDTLNRTLMGHSYAGYFSLFHLFDKADEPFFDNIAALSPVLWYANDRLFGMEADAFATQTPLPYNLYLGVGELEGVYFNATFDAFQAQLKEHNHNGFQFQAEHYPGSHTFSAKTGFLNALQFFYD